MDPRPDPAYPLKSRCHPPPPVIELTMPYITDVYLSEVLKKDVIDQFGRRVGALWDLVIIPGVRFPTVVKLILKDRGKRLEVSTDQLQLFNPFVISLDLSGGSPRPYQARDEDILAGKDILDKQILDINGAKVVRVNDLKLGESDGAVCVLGIDVGLNGLLRRVDGGTLVQKAFEAFKKPIRENIIAWGYLQTIDPDLRNLTLTVARKQLGELHPSELAEILTEIPPEEGSALLSSVDEELAGEALHEVSSEVREQLLEEMDKETISDILEEMPPDEAADILGDMPEEQSKELLSMMETEDAAEVKDLLSYEDDTAGGLMTTEFLDFPPDLTIEEALTNIRLLVPDVEFIYYIYVVDEEDRPLGVLTLKKLLTSPLHVRLGDVMTQSVKHVNLDSDLKEIAETISKYDFIALPVVDEEHRMRGIITVDDILDVLVPNPIRRKRRKTLK